MKHLEEEKDFDRATALETIKYILSQGYHIGHSH